MKKTAEQLASQRSKRLAIKNSRTQLPRDVIDGIRPFVELFSVVDSVMDEPGAFDPDSIHKSLGRIYRQWLDTREEIDPNFDRARYRHEMKSRQKTPLGNTKK